MPNQKTIPVISTNNISHPSISSHRGAFGEYGGDSLQFIDRTFVEKILLVGVTIRETRLSQTLTSLSELMSLVRTAGANPVEKLLIKRDAPHPSTYIGKGKLEELHQTCEELDIDTVVFDNDLTVSQQVNLEKVIGRSAIDRTTVILDIFAQNATSLEGKVQVELAQLKHRTAKLKRSGVTYSQQAGGIGSRGPGETKLETDRRSILRRVRQLEKQLTTIAKRRDNQVKRRTTSSISNIALVGYTNAGKSSLLNVLTDSTAIVKNHLFSTLEATTRKLKLPGGQTCLLTDTVGFIKKLPHTLIEAFASTLAGIAEADLLIHIADITAKDLEERILEVNSVLEMIGAQEISQLFVFNKIDKINNIKVSNNIQQTLLTKYQSAKFISTKTEQGIAELLEEIPAQLHTATELLLIPYSQGRVMADIHRLVRVLEKESVEDGVLFKVELTDQTADHFLKYRVCVS